MPGVNITKVYLLDVPLENDYKNTLYFASKTAQQTYFQSRIQKSETNFSFQRKDHKIRWPAHIDTLYGCNYVMYQNTYYSNKWFYAFITKMEYIDDGRTDIYIETDCIQTWYFDFTVKPSFIDREHTDYDGIGANIVDENLQLSEYTCTGHDTAGFGGDELAIVIGVTANQNHEQYNGTLYNNIYSGIKYFAFKNKMNDNEHGIGALNDFLQQYDEEALGESVTCMFMAPSTMVSEALVRSDHMVVGTNTLDQYWINISGTSSHIKTINFDNDNVDTYSPRNKKLLTYPYKYILASNNNGQDVIYKYENFYTGRGDQKTVTTPKFHIRGCLTPGCSVRMVPLNYNGVFSPNGETGGNEIEGLNLGKYPCLNWTSDIYTNWLTQNGVNIGIDIVSNAMQIVGGAMASTTGVGATVGIPAMVNGISGIASTLTETHKQSLTPPQSKGNLNCGDVVTATGENDFHFYKMSIRIQSAKIIDNFFDMFGYKTNRVKTPNTNHRERWWYTKTIDVNIDGGIPNEDMQIIKNAYNNGITFWRNASEIQNYSLSNNII